MPPPLLLDRILATRDVPRSKAELRQMVAPEAELSDEPDALSAVGTGALGLALQDPDMLKNAIDTTGVAGSAENDPRLLLRREVRSELTKRIKPALAKRFGGHDALTDIVTGVLATTLQSDPEMQQAVMGVTEGELPAQFSQAGFSGKAIRWLLKPITKRLVGLAAEGGAKKVAAGVVETEVKSAVADAAKEGAKGAGKSLAWRGAKWVGGSALTLAPWIAYDKVSEAMRGDPSAPAGGDDESVGAEQSRAVASDYIRKWREMHQDESNDALAFYRTAADMLQPADGENAANLARAILVNLGRETAIAQELGRRARMQGNADAAVSRFFKELDGQGGLIPVPAGAALPNDDLVRAARAAKYGVLWDSPKVDDAKMKEIGVALGPEVQPSPIGQAQPGAMPQRQVP